jgi:hypothetical protein
MKRPAAVAVVAILVLSCGKPRYQTYGASTASPGPGGAPQVLQTPELVTPTPFEFPKEGSFAIELVDDNGLHPPGIGVKMTGRVDRSLVSDASGKITGAVPAGDYQFQIGTGCFEDVIVRSGGNARVGVAGGAATKGTLRVSWQHRYIPGAPAYSDSGSNWPLGKPVKMTFRLTDRCSGKPAAGKPFGTFEYVTSPNLGVTGSPAMRSNGSADASATLRCKKKGPVELSARDRLNPTDSIDLIKLSIDAGGSPRCV